MLLCVVLFFTSAVMSSELRMQLENLQDKEIITVIVLMNAEYPFDAVENFPIKEKAQIFREIARGSQQTLVNFLKQFPEGVNEIKQYWVFNGMHITATKKVIEHLVNRDDVKYILHNGIIELPNEGKNSDIRTTEWNIKKIMADSCWNAGYTGENVLIGILDTGCDFTHPALSGKWSGYWRDCVNGQTQPYDDNGHGIFMSGIICGGDGFGPFVDDIGVAPGSKLVVAKVFNSQGAGQYTWIDEGMQWIADLKVDSGVDIRAVSNSWGSNTYELHFWNICLTWKSIGILGIWSIGSSGPGQGTCTAPGNYPLVLGCGATDSFDNIASFSSRGPAPDQPPWNDTIYWLRRDWNLTKPDIVAPGVSIRSSSSNGGYMTMSGTSLANSHVAGGVAILCQANPNLTVTQLYNLFLNNADSIYYGGYPNNTYGWGRLNLWQTLQSVPGIKENNKFKVVENIIIMPNPFSGQLKLTNLPDGCNISLYNAIGRKVYICISDKGTIVIALPVSIRNGVYFLEVKTKSDLIVRKVTLLR
ncbi:MAG: S8 family serine peptidase [candidate division WOR-3 bacterium]